MARRRVPVTMPVGLPYIQRFASPRRGRDRGCHGGGGYASATLLDAQRISAALCCRRGVRSAPGRMVPPDDARIGAFHRRSLREGDAGEFIQTCLKRELAAGPNTTVTSASVRPSSDHRAARAGAVVESDDISAPDRTRSRRRSGSTAVDCIIRAFEGLSR